MLQSYQLHLEVSGGHHGSLKLIEIQVESHKDHVFGSERALFQAVDLARGQMLAGLEDSTATTSAAGYLATFTYRSSRDARGPFVIELKTDSDGGDQTFLIGAEQSKIEVLGSPTAVIDVIRPRR